MARWSPPPPPPPPIGAVGTAEKVYFHVLGDPTQWDAAAVGEEEDVDKENEG